MDRVQLKLAGKKNFQKNRGASVVACLPYTLLDFIMRVITLVIVLMFCSKIFTVIMENNSRVFGYNNQYYLQSIANIYRSLVNVTEEMSRIEPVVFPVFLEVLIGRFFLMNRMRGSCKASEAFSSFKGSEYFKTVGVMFLIGLWLIIPYFISDFSKYLSSHFHTYLFSYLSSMLSVSYVILLIIGIIKFYFSYFMVPYILAENPNIGVKRAITISNKTMNGVKGDLFVFYLSFLGWYILSNATFGILRIFYVRPYYEAAKAEFYSCVKQKAKKMKICRPGELM